MAKKKSVQNYKVRKRTVVSKTLKGNNCETVFMFVVIIVNLLLLVVISDNPVLFVRAEEDYMTSEELEYTYQTGDRTTVDIVEGQNASLPCSVAIPADDTPALTLWYVGTDQTPIYSYDQRGNSKKGSGWADPLLFGDQRFPTGVRVKFDIHQDPPSLIIFDVRQQDSREYRCRVDFSKSTSEFAWAVLKVVVPPKRINLLTQISFVSPGDSNDVVCQVSGGIPPASVLWIQKGQVVDANYNVTAGVSYNSLEKVAERGDLDSPFTCTAHNNDITAPLTTEYLRNVTCGPLSMKVVSHPKVLSAGRPGELRCKVIGSNPSPIIKWFRRGKIFESGNITTNHDVNITTSVLTFIPTREDQNSQVVCRAENEFLPLATLEDIVTLEVTYGPVIDLKIGWPALSQTEAIKEGSDVFLECSLDSNPKVYKISWYKNGNLLRDTAPSKSVVSDTTLALNKITRHSSGRYQCFASNVEGDGFSNNVTITIEYAPVCAHGPLLLGVALNVLTNVTCRVEAEPLPETFSWTFDRSNKRDGSAAQRKTSERSSRRDWKYIASGLESTLFYTARSSKDYGIVKCFAHNSIDTQRRPCIIKIVSEEEAKLSEENKYEHYNNKATEEKIIEKITPAPTEAITLPKTTEEKPIRIKPTTEKPRPKIPEEKKYHKPTIEVKKKHNPPSDVVNCIVLNVTTHTAGVTCQPGASGEQDEQFNVQVHRDDTHEIVFNETLSNCAFFTITNLLPSHLYSAAVIAFNQHGHAKPKKFSLRTGKLTRVEKTFTLTGLPSQTPSTSVAWATGGTVSGIVLIIILALGVRWFIKRPPNESLSKLSIRTLSKKDSTKEKGNLLKGASSNPEEATMNGVFEYTIYDSSGRYRGFSHLPPQMPGGRYPVPVASGGSCEDPTTSTNLQSNCTDKNDTKDLDKIDNVTSNNASANANNSNVKLKTSRGWAKLRGALVFIRKSNYKLDFKRIVHPRHGPDNKDQESKI